MQGQQHAQGSLLSHALEWWHQVRESWQRMHELDGVSDHEIERMAHDLGMSPDELVGIAQQPAGMGLLLDKRLAALHLDPEEIRKLSPILLADLQRTCANCGDKKRCAADFKLNESPEGWQAYCPNARTLETIS